MTVDLTAIAGLFAKHAGPQGLIILTLFAIIVFERWSCSRSKDKLVNMVIKTLYEKGHLDERRRAQLPIEEERRKH